MSGSRSMGLLPVVAIGVGGMVGGGIFAVLGLAVQMTRGGAPLAFLLAGLVALITAYSYARLSIAVPSQGGTVEFLNRAFGTGLLSGSLNVLLWLSYVVMLSLYAYTFGSYGAGLVQEGSNPVLRHSLISLVIVLLTGLNAVGSRAVGRAETWIVLAKLAILLLFVVVGLATLTPTRLAPQNWSSPLALAGGGMLIFLAYEGFELIANTAQDIRSPERNLPVAFYSAVTFVIVLYVAVATVVVGNLPVPEIVQARDYALAKAATPFLGQTGFTLIAVAALLSTASAINATLYGAARVSYVIAQDGELPEVLEHKVWRRPVEGLLITAGITLLVANLFDLSSIATMGSAGFLVVFAAVNGANLMLARDTGGRPWLAVLGLVACLVALAVLMVEGARQDPKTLLFLPVMLLMATGVEALYRRIGRRRSPAGGRPEGRR